MSDSTPAIAKPVGVSGVVSYGGILVSSDYDRAWQGAERDRTIQAMTHDPVIGAVLMAIEMLVRKIDWHVAPADESGAAEDAAAFVQECLDDMEDHWPGDTLAKVLTYLGWGWAVLELVYKRRAGPDGTPPSRFADGRTGWHRWALRPQPTRYGWEFAGDDPTALVQQDPTSYKRISIPLAKCLHFRYAARDNSPEGTTPLRVAHDAWWNKRKIQKIEAIGIERDLAGLPVGRTSAEDIAGNTAAYQAMQTIVTNIRNDAQAGLVLASDRDESGNYYQDITLLNTGGQRAFDTDPIVKRYANEIVTVFLANVMRTGQDATGSYALADVQGGLFQQAIVPLCRLNGISAELAPALKHGDIESADLARLGAYVVALGQAGLLVDTPELRSFLHEVAGLPAPTPEEMAAQAAAEDAERAEREAAAREALERARAKQSPGSNGVTGPVGEDGPEASAASPNGAAMTAGEVRRFVEADGTLTLSDIVAIMEWWDASVPAEYRGLLNAEVVTR
jgi:hypothetical protein